MTEILSLVKKKQWESVIQRCKVAKSHEVTIQDASNFKATPLHLALERDAPFEVIKCLIENGTQCTQMKECRNGYLPLFTAIRHRATLGVIALLVTSYKEAIWSRDKKEWSSIHLACFFNSNFKVVSFLLQLDPSLAKTSTKKNDTALHIACRRKCNPKIVKRLLQLYPEAARVAVEGSWYPLHLAIWHEASIEVIDDLIMAYPNASRMTTSSSGQTPLSLYWSNYQISKPMVTLLLRHFPEKNNHGMIHAVLQFKPMIPNLLDYIVKEFKNDAALFDKDGQLPLHAAIGMKAMLESQAWKKIFNCNPLAIAQPHKGNRLLPFMIAAAKSDVELTYQLLCLAPNAVLCKLHR